MKHNISQDLSGFNSEQVQAIMAQQGPVLVVAGPGSGKTKVLVQRVVHCISQHSIPPENIYVVTFTKKASDEFKERLQKVLPNALFEQMQNLGTFHNVCLKILRKHMAMVKPDFAQFSVVDDFEKKKIITQCMQKMAEKSSLGLMNVKMEKIMSFISKWKNNQLSCDAVIKSIIDDQLQTAQDLDDQEVMENKNVAYYCAWIYKEYETVLESTKRIDFDDMLLYTAKLFEKKEEVRKKYARQCKALLIDEFQDTNDLQYKIARYLTMEHKNLFVVGDPNQSIYGWRNANVGLLQQLQKDFTSLQVCYLMQNYRSSQNIVQLSHAIVEYQQKKQQQESEASLHFYPELTTKNSQGAPVSVLQTSTPDIESTMIAAEILKLIQLSNQQLMYRDFAILIRTNAMSRAFEIAFKEAGIPFHIKGSVEFFERREIKDILAYLDLISNLENDRAFERIVNVPKRGCGATYLKNLKVFAGAKKVSLFEALRRGSEQTEPVKGCTPKPKLLMFVKQIAALSSGNPPTSQSATGESIGESVFKLPLPQFVQKVLDLMEYEAEELKKNNSPSDYQSRLDNVNEFINYCAEYAEHKLAMPDASPSPTTPVPQLLHDLKSFLSFVPRNTEPTAAEQNVNRVTISTLHAAKGLEYGIVFMPGVEDGIIPHSKANTTAQEEEEARLLFVGMTRAKALLYITFNTFRRYNTKVKRSFISPFLLHLLPFNTKLFDNLQGPSKKLVEQLIAINKDKWLTRRTSAASQRPMVVPEFLSAENQQATIPWSEVISLIKGLRPTDDKITAKAYTEDLRLAKVKEERQHQEDE